MLYIIQWVCFENVFAHRKKIAVLKLELTFKKWLAKLQAILMDGCVPQSPMKRICYAFFLQLAFLLHFFESKKLKFDKYENFVAVCFDIWNKIVDLGG